ncbi:MAG: DUF2279 domain-containing protein [Chitinophagaceae bacterium]|nr:DUF2279 domain-containing protein [Chitinophagaceae bacterium]
MYPRASLLLLCVFTVIFCKNTKGQNSFSEKSFKSFRFTPTSLDSAVNTTTINRSREKWLIGTNVVAYAGTLTALSVMWYANYPRSGFHFFNDDNEWMQVDKAGHMYSAYLISHASSEMWRWAGASRKTRIWVGGLSGLAYQSIIEVLDGFSAEYGFSPGDYTANILGSAAFISQELLWDEQRIKIKFSTYAKRYKDPGLEQRANKIYGESLAERFLKDYNMQNYWLSANIQSLFHSKTWPAWLNIAVGYGADGMFGANGNTATDKTGNIIFDRQDIKRFRQWYLSPDLAFTKIKTRKKGIKVLLFVLDSFKFPAPALEFSNGKFKGHWLYF